MNKKYIKIIKHLYKNLQKKDELKNDFNETSYSIYSSFFFIYFFSLFIFFLYLSISFMIISFNSITNHNFINLLINTIFSVIFAVVSTRFTLIELKLILFNKLISKNLKKYDIFNLYGRNYDFNIFLSNIIEEILDKTEKEDIKPYIKEIIHIINSIPDESIQDNIKMKLVKKMEIDICSQLVNLAKHKTEEENMIKIDCKSIVVNS